MNEHGYIMFLIGGVLGWLGKYWADRLQRQELFDHRLRIEKEYQIYTDLWDKLFEFRRAVHGIVDTLQRDAEEDPHKRYVDTFNAFQAVVRRNEPFIYPSVYEPSRTIVEKGRTISSALQRIKSLDDYRNRIRDLDADEQAAEKQIAEDENQEQAAEQIDRLFPQVCDAIRSRITPKFRSIV